MTPKVLVAMRLMAGIPQPSNCTKVITRGTIAPLLFCDYTSVYLIFRLRILRVKSL